MMWVVVSRIKLRYLVSPSVNEISNSINEVKPFSMNQTSQNIGVRESPNFCPSVSSERSMGSLESKRGKKANEKNKQQLSENGAIKENKKTEGKQITKFVDVDCKNNKLTITDDIETVEFDRPLPYQECETWLEQFDRIRADYTDKGMSIILII